MSIPVSPQASPNVVLREEFKGQYLLFHLETGSLTGLNPVGAFIWQQLDGQTDTSSLIDKMVSVFQVTRETAGADMAAFLEILADKQLLVTADGGTS